MELEFYKIHTCQNDFILVSYLYRKEAPALEWFPTIARSMCSRHLGVGANGLIVLLPGVEHPVKLLVFRPNGQPAELYNDALLCMSRYAFDSGVAGGERIAVECPTGIKTVDFIDSNHFRISIGTPRSIDDMSELHELPDRDYHKTVEVDGKKVPFTPVHLQYSAAVVFAGDTGRSKLKRLSRSMRRSPAMTDPGHPVFSRIYSKDEIEIFTWFKQEAVDYASAAGAATVSAVLNGLSDREVIAHCNKQELYVQWVQSANEVLVTSAADYIFSGSYYLEEEHVHHRGPDI